MNGRDVTFWRTQNNYSQQDLADALHLHVDKIRRIEALADCVVGQSIRDGIRNLPRRERRKVKSGYRLMPLSERLRSVRETLGASQEEMAILLKVSHGSIAAWEKGKTPGPDNYERVRRNLTRWSDDPSPARAKLDELRAEKPPAGPPPTEVQEMKARRNYEGASRFWRERHSPGPGYLRALMAATRSTAKEMAQHLNCSVGEVNVILGGTMPNSRILATLKALGIWCQHDGDGVRLPPLPGTKEGREEKSSRSTQQVEPEPAQEEPENENNTTLIATIIQRHSEEMAQLRRDYEAGEETLQEAFDARVASLHARWAAIALTIGIAGMAVGMHFIH